MPRLGFSAGLQMIDMTLDAVSSMRGAPGYVNPLLKGKQMQWMAGLDYTVGDGVYLALNYGWITTENTYNTTSGVLGSNMPDYADIMVRDADGNVVKDPESGKNVTVPEYTHKFSQAVVQAVLNVKF